MHNQVRATRQKPRITTLDGKSVQGELQQNTLAILQQYSCEIPLERGFHPTKPWNYHGLASSIEIGQVEGPKRS